MSETTKPRTLDQINQEYTALCAKAGQTQYQIELAQADLKALNAALRDVNTEAAKSKQFYDALEAAKVTPITEGSVNA